MKIALTGGIACGKSLVAKYLNEEGVATLDADDVVHELVPEDERRRLAAVVFKDPLERAKLERRIHPLVKARLEEFLRAPGDSLKVVIVPLLFEVRWEGEYDIICCVSSARQIQISRMMELRGYSKAEAEARLAAQLPVAEKCEKSHYVISNDGSSDELRTKVAEFVGWLKGREKNG